MNPPRWDSPGSDAVREELLRRVAVQEPGRTSPAPHRPRRGAVRLVVALVIALALVVPASVLAVQLGARPAPAGSSTLVVATDASYAYNPMGDYAGVVGVLHASRTAHRACFWVTATETSGAFGSGSFFLVFPAGSAATAHLALLDGDGEVVAEPGDPVLVFTTPQLLGSRAAGCASGPTLGALHVEREIGDRPSVGAAAEPLPARAG